MADVPDEAAPLDGVMVTADDPYDRRRSHSAELLVRHGRRPAWLPVPRWSRKSSVRVPRSLAQLARNPVVIAGATAGATLAAVAVREAFSERARAGSRAWTKGAAVASPDAWVVHRVRIEEHVRVLHRIVYLDAG